MENRWDGLELTTTSSLDGPVLDRVSAIYGEAFPARQREPIEVALQQDADGSGVAFVAMAAEVPVGLCFLSHLPSVGHLFLTYFAVASHRRGQGIGAALWGAAARELDARGLTSSVVLEVEDPGQPGIEPGERDIRRRRLEFWRRAGASLLPDVGYEIPYLEGSGTEPMRLLRFGKVPLEAERLLPLVLALLTEGYGLDDQHPLLVKTRAGLA